jgi:thiol-disulfide isomerase/thioredoxin
MLYIGFVEKIKMHNLLVLLFLTFFISSIQAIEVNAQAASCPAVLESDKIPLDLQKYRGKVIYLDFWATWCPPCKKSMPFLNALRNELFDQGFEVIAINVDEDSEDARLLLQQYPVDYAIAMDPSGKCPTQYDVKAMPSAYLIDRQGTIRHIHLGFRKNDEQEIRKRIIQLLGKNDEHT